MPREKRGPRTLVRWDQEMDILCLLAIPRVLARRDIKFPWAEVAAYVGHNVTGNALLQHLAKVNKKRKDAGLSIPEDTEHQVGEMREYQLIASAGFGDRRTGNNKPRSRRQHTDASNDTDKLTKTVRHAVKSSPKIKVPVNKSSKARSRRAKSASVKSEYDSDDNFSDVARPLQHRASKAREATKRARSSIEDDADWAGIDNHSDAEFQPSAKKKKIAHNVVTQVPLALPSSQTLSPKIENSKPKQKGRVIALSFRMKQPEFLNKVGEWHTESAGSSQGLDHFGSFGDVLELDLELPSPTGNQGFALENSPPIQYHYDPSHVSEHRNEFAQYEAGPADDFPFTDFALASPNFANSELPDGQALHSRFMSPVYSQERSQFSIFEDEPKGQGHDTYTDMLGFSGMIDDKQALM